MAATAFQADVRHRVWMDAVPWVGSGSLCFGLVRLCGLPRPNQTRETHFTECPAPSEYAMLHTSGIIIMSPSAAKEMSLACAHSCHGTCCRHPSVCR